MAKRSLVSPKFAIFYSVKCAENCAELYDRGETESGVYRISPQPKIWFDVYCDQDMGLLLIEVILTKTICLSVKYFKLGSKEQGKFDNL